MIDQRTDEWFARRCGKVTSSRIADALAKTKTGWGAGREKYATQLALERLTGRSLENQFMSQAMKNGVEREPFARAEYEAKFDELVFQIDFVDHPDLPWGGASPDGRVDPNGLVEFKCPEAHTHAGYLIDVTGPDKIPQHYRQQMTWQIICDGRVWCDWCSYHPDFPEKLQLKVVRFVPTDDDRKAMLKDLAEFNADVDRKVEQLRKLME